MVGRSGERLIVFALVACTHAYVLTSPRAMPALSPRTALRPQIPTAPTFMAEAAADEPSKGGVRAWFKKWAKFDKDQLKTLGVDAFFTYGVVSNINAGFTVALAWSTFSKATGLSPLAPGCWGKFLGTYAGIYLSLGSILRPFRFALAVGATPLYTKLITGVRDNIPFRESRPKLNRTLALILVSLALNVVGTSLIIFLGIWGAGFLTGVPAFPPNWVSPFGGGGA